MTTNRIMQLSVYLGQPVAELLKSAPFKNWPYDRCVEHELDEPRIDYLFVDIGLSVICDESETIHTMFLVKDRGIDGPRLSEIPFASNREEVLRRIGEPSAAGAFTIDPVLGTFGAWDRFLRPEAIIHIEYQLYSDRIRQITLIAPTAAPQCVARSSYALGEF